MNRMVAMAAAMVLWGSGATANDFEPQLREILDERIRPILTEPVVVEAVKAQNGETAGLDQAAIDGLDTQWRDEEKAGNGPLIDKVLANALSKYLQEVKSGSDGLYAEIFVMDAKGLNVGQSDVTSDYFQGDEAKWQKTFQAGPDGVLIDEVEFDDSSEQFQSQVSVTIVDPASGEAIGAVTVGVNVEKL